MSDNSNQNKGVLVLSDGAGNYYAIPRDVVQAHRVTGEQRDQIEKALGDDVSGYGMMAGPGAAGPGAAGPGAAGPGMAGPGAAGPGAAGPGAAGPGMAGPGAAGPGAAGPGLAGPGVMLSGGFMNIPNFD